MSRANPDTRGDARADENATEASSESASMSVSGNGVQGAPQHSPDNQEAVPAADIPQQVACAAQRAPPGTFCHAARHQPPGLTPHAYFCYNTWQMLRGALPSHLPPILMVLGNMTTPLLARETFGGGGCRTATSPQHRLMWRPPQSSRRSTKPGARCSSAIKRQAPHLNQDSPWGEHAVKLT